MLRYFFVDPGHISATHARIDGQEAQHIKTVLRLKPGDHIGLCDGTGNLYDARITRLTSAGVEAEILNTSPVVSEPPIRITLAQALIKDQKMDLLVRHLTELGISRWIPFASSRSAPRPAPDRSQRRLQRWQKITREAMKQSRRGRLPEIESPKTFENLLELGRIYSPKIIFWEKATQPLTATVENPLDILLVLGPEGGFSTAEIDQAHRVGFTTATLGPRILRAETAALAACTLAQYLYGDMGP